MPIRQRAGDLDRRVGGSACSVRSPWAWATTRRIISSMPTHPALSYFDHPPMMAWVEMAGLSFPGRERRVGPADRLHRAVRRVDVDPGPADGRYYGDGPDSWRRWP